MNKSVEQDHPHFKGGLFICQYCGSIPTDPFICLDDIPVSSMYMSDDILRQSAKFPYLLLD